MVLEINMLSKISWSQRKILDSFFQMQNVHLKQTENDVYIKGRPFGGIQ
jgi:hypothetical protein